MIPSRLLSRLSIADLRAALKHKVQFGRVETLESEKETLLKQVAKLDKKLARLGSNGAAPAGRKRRRWKLSAATRRKMAEAARKRWAKAGGKAKAAAKPAPAKRRRTLSAATRAKMAAAAKARWAKVRGAKTGK